MTIKLQKSKKIEEHVAFFKYARDAHRFELIDDYIELIDDLIKQFGEARQVEIVIRLGVSQPTVAKMLKKLSKFGLIKYVPYRGIFLTPKGDELAIKSKARHYIVEKFLLALGVSLKTARCDSEGLEHHVSDETLVVFKDFLKNVKISSQ